MIRKYSQNTNVKAIATLVLILLIVYFIIRPISVNTYTKYLQVKKYNNDIAILEKNLEALSIIRRITKDYAEEINLIAGVIPTEAREKDFLRDVAVLCGKNQVNLTSTNFTHYSDNIVFDMNLEGRYENTVKLLNDIDNMLRLTNIEALTVSTSEGGPSQGTVIVGIAGKIFKKPS